MKYSDYFLAPGVRTTATFIGILIGCAIGLFTSWQYGLIAGVACAVFLTVLIPFLAYRQDRPYAKIKATLQGPFRFDERVRFLSPAGAFSGYLILTDERMYLLSLEKGEVRMELTRDDVKSVTVAEDTCLQIFLSDTQYIRVVSAVAEEVLDFLGQHGWNTVRH